MKKQLSYLNGVLTVIAIALTVLVLQNADIIPKAYAAGMPYATVPLNAKGEVPVAIMSGDMDVRVTNRVDVEVENTVKIKEDGPLTVKSDYYAPLNVNIERVGGNTFSGGELPVRNK